MDYVNKIPKVSFVIPFHNEAKNCRLMLEQVLKYSYKQKWDFEIIAVNDRSQDETGTIIDEYSQRFKFIYPLLRSSDSQTLSNTMGLALLEGTKMATGDIIIWTMGDRTDDPETYSKMVKQIQKGDDLVLGSRYMKGGTWGNLDPTKAFLSSRGTVLARILFGVKVHDITNAFRCFRKELIDKITLGSKGFAISPEFAIKAHLLGFKLGEVPTVYRDRVEGVSNFKLWKMTWEYLKLYFKLFFKFP